MGRTVKEFAVKITGDTKQLSTVMDNLKTKAQALQIAFKNMFGSGEAVKAAQKTEQAISSEIDKIFKNTKQKEELIRKEREKTKQSSIKSSRDRVVQESKIDQSIEKSQKRIEQLRRKSATDSEKIENQRIKNISTAQRAANKESEKLQRDQLKVQQQVAKEAERAKKESLKRQIKAQQDAAKEFQKAAKGGFKNPIGAIEKDQPIKDVQALGRALQSANKSVQERIRVQLKNLDSNKQKDIKQGQQALLRIITDAQNQQIKQLQQASRRRLQLVGNSSTKRKKIERQLQAEITKIQADGQKRRAAVARTAAKRKTDAPKEQKVGRIGKGGAIFGQLSQQASGFGGSLGGVLSKLGPVGAGLAALVGVAGALGSAIIKTGKAFMAFEDDRARVQTLLTDEQSANLEGPILKLRKAAIETGEPLKNLQKGMFNVISAAPKLANNLEAASDIAVKASKTALGLGASTDQVVLAAAGLGNAMGLSLEDTENVNFLMDTLAQTMKQGVIPNAGELATNISKNAPAMAALFSNTKEATKSLGNMTAVLTGNGVKLAESQTQIKALGQELLNSKTQAKLFALGVEGINKETGKVDDIRKVFQSMSKDTKAFVDVFRSADAQNAIRIFTKEGGDAFSDMMDTFDSAGGASERMFQTMLSTGSGAGKSLEATWQDLLITMGEGSAGVMADVQSATSEVLGSLNELFKSSKQELAESDQRLDALIGNIEAVGMVAEDVEGTIQKLQTEGKTTGKEVDDAIKKIGETANSFKGDFPLVAEQIHSIIDAQGEKTVQTLVLLNEQLGKAQDLAKAEAFVEGFKNSEFAVESLTDQIHEAQVVVQGTGSAVVDWLTLAFGSFVNPALAVKAGTDLIKAATNVDVITEAEQRLQSVQAHIEALRKKREGLDRSDAGGAEKIVSITKQLNGLVKRRNELAASKLSIETGIEKTVAKQISQAQKLIESGAANADLATEILAIRDDMKINGELEGKELDKVNESIQKQADLLGVGADIRRTLAEETANELQMQIEKQQAIVDANEGSTNTDALGIHEAVLNSLQLQLEATQDIIEGKEEINEADIEILGTGEDIADTNELSAELIEEQVSAAADLNDTKLEDSDIQSGINELIKDALDIEDATTENKIKQLELLFAAKKEELDILTAKLKQLQAEDEKLKKRAQNVKLSEEERKKAIETAAALRQQTAALTKQVQILGQATAAIQGKIGDIKGGATISKTLGLSGGGGGGGSRSRKDSKREAEKAEKEKIKAEKKAQKAKAKAEKKVEKEKAKAEKDRQKAMDRAQKDRMKKAKDIEKQRDKEAKERLKISIERLKKQKETVLAEDKARRESIRQVHEHARALKEAQERIASEVKQFADGLREERRAEIKGSLSGLSKLLDPLRSDAENLRRNLDALSQSALRGREGLEQGIKDRKEIIVAELKKVDDAEDRKQEIFEEITEETRNDLADLKSARKDNLKRTKELEGAVISWKKQLKFSEKSLGIWNKRLDAAKGIGSEYISATVNVAKLGKEVDNLKKNIKEVSGRKAEGFAAVAEGSSSITGIEGENEKVFERMGVIDKEIVKINEKITIQKALNVKATESLAKNTGEITDLDAEAIVKNFQAAATGLQGFSTELDKVIDLQSQALLAADPKDMVATFKEAEDELMRIEQEFSLFGVSLTGLFEQANKLGTEFGGKIDEIVGILPEGQRKNAKFLLENALQILKTQAKIKDELVKTNNEVKDISLKIKEQEKIQENLNTAFEKSQSLIKETNQVQKSNAQQTKENFAAAKKAIDDQLTAAKTLIAEEARLLEIQKEKKDETGEQIKGLDKLILKKKEEITLAQTEGKGENEIVALNDDLSALKQQLDEVKSANDIYTESVNKSSIALSENKENTRKLASQTAQLNQALPKAKEAADIKDLDQSFSDAGNNAIKMAMAVKDAFDLGQVAKGMEGVKNIIVGVSKDVESIASLTIDSINQVDDIIADFSGGREAAGAQKIGDITQKIGEALLGAPDPNMKIAGAILLGVGLITKLAAQIVDLFVVSEDTGREKAEQRLKVLERQTLEYQRQLELNQELNALQSTQSDTAQERLDLLNAAFNSQRSEGSELGVNINRLADFTDDQLAAEAKKQQDRIDELNFFKEKLEALAEEENTATQQNKLVRLSYTLEDEGIFTYGELNIFEAKANIEKALDDIEGQIADVTGESDAIDLILQFRKDQFAALEEVFTERIQELDFRVEAAIELENFDRALELFDMKLGASRERASDGFAILGEDITGLTIKTADDVRAIVDGLDGIDIPPNVQASIEQYIATLEEGQELAISVFRTQLELIDARFAAEKITKNESNEQKLKILEEQLDFLMLQGASELEILRVEAEILALKKEQNGEDAEANEALSKAVRQRQKLLELIRRESEGGSLDATQRQQIETSEQTIINELRASGASEDEINAFIGQLPAFAAGGIVPDTGLALVTKGEAIIPVNRMKEIEEQLELFSAMITKNNPIVNGTDSITREASALMLNKEAQNINNNDFSFSLGDIIINMNIPDRIADPKAVVSQVKNEIGDIVLSTVQRGFDQNKIDIRGKSI